MAKASTDTKFKDELATIEHCESDKQLDVQQPENN